MSVFLALCAEILLLPIESGFTSQCLDIGPWSVGPDRAAAIGGRVPDAVGPLNPARWLCGRGTRLKVRQCQSNCTPV